MAFLAGCLSTPKKTESEPIIEAPEVVLPSADPIINASPKEIAFAQSALKKMGYRITSVDGIWGPKSAQAMLRFEQKNAIQSADGHLSQLNLFHLEKQSGIRISDIRQPRVKRKKRQTGLTAQLGAQTDFANGPKLVIANQNYSLYQKPSLQSAKPTTIIKGTGLFVIDKQDNWYEVEAENKIRGYILAN